MTLETGPAADAALARLVVDWQTIWRSELQALAVDPEAHEALEYAVRVAALASRVASDSAGPAAGADAPSRPTAAAAASDARDAAILRLEQRVAELERLLAQSRRDGG